MTQRYRFNLVEKMLDISSVDMMVYNTPNLLVELISTAADGMRKTKVIDPRFEGQDRDRIVWAYDKELSPPCYMEDNNAQL